MSSFVERVRAVAVAWVLLVVPCMLVTLVMAGCDSGVEATTDNLSHFASVTSELRRDARELELLAKKVGAVRTKLERRRSEIAEHVWTDEMATQRNSLLERWAQKPSEAADAAVPTEASLPSSDTLVGVIALHDHLFQPLRVFDDSLSRDVDYGWWIDELGLTSADLSLVGDETRDERTRAFEDCRTSFDANSRAAACRALLDNHTTPAYFSQVKQQWLGDLDTEINRLGLIQAQFEAEAVERRASAGKVMEAYGSSFDGLIIWGFPALIIAVLIIVLFEGRRRRLNPGGQSLDTLAVITVLLLVSAIIILGLGGKIQPEALGTLIGGISGYVLGKSAQTMFGAPSEKRDSDAEPKVSAAATVTSASVGGPQPGPAPATEPVSAEPMPAESVSDDKPQLLAAAPANDDSAAAKK